MINLEKIKEFEEYRGCSEGFFRQKVMNKTDLTSSDEWQLMDELLQDCKLSTEGLISQEYSEKLEQRLKENFDNQENIDYFKRLVNNEW